MPSKELHRQMVVAAKAAQHAPGQCTFSTLYASLGVRADPEVLSIKQMVVFWFKHWSQADEDKKRLIRRLWLKSLRELSNHKGDLKWNMVHGPMKALMCSSKRLGWLIPDPIHWISNDKYGQVHHVFNWLGDCSELHRAIEHCVMQINAPRIGAHHACLGAPEYVRFDIARAHIEKLRRQQREADANILLNIVSGATWPQTRRFEKG